MKVNYSSENVIKGNKSIRRTITKLCLMMGITEESDVRTVISEVENNTSKYESLISEFNATGYNDKTAILLYYSPAVLNNAKSYYKKMALRIRLLNH